MWLLWATAIRNPWIGAHNSHNPPRSRGARRCGRALPPNRGRGKRLLRSGHTRSGRGGRGGDGSARPGRDPAPATGKRPSPAEARRSRPSRRGAGVTRRGEASTASRTAARRDCPAVSGSAGRRPDRTAERYWRGMRRLTISLRWWLALAFAAIAAVTAVAVAEVLTQRAQGVLSDRAEEIATGSSVVAAREITSALTQQDVTRTIDVLAAGRKLSLFVFDRQRHLLTQQGSRGVRFGADPLDREALDRALAGSRFVDHSGDGSRIAVGLPLRTPRAAALVAIAFRKDLVAEAGILHTEILRAAGVAILVGALVGLGVATPDRPPPAPDRLGGGRDRGRAPSTSRAARGLARRGRRPRGDDRPHARPPARVVRGAGVGARPAAELLERLHEGVVAVDPRARGRAREPGRAADLRRPCRSRRARRSPSRGRRLRAARARGEAVRERCDGISQARVVADQERTFALVGIPAGTAPTWPSSSSPT